MLSSNRDEHNRTVERRSQILDAATRALVRKGFHNTTMDDIVAESSLSKGTLYLYFKSKKDIFLELCNRYIELLNSEIARQMVGRTSLVDQMRAVADAYVLVFRESNSLGGSSTAEAAKLTAEFWSQAVLDPEIKARFVETYYFYSQLSEDLVKAAVERGEFRPVDTATVTLLLTSVYDGLTWRWLLNPEEMDWRHTTETLFDMVLNGLTPRQPQ